MADMAPPAPPPAYVQYLPGAIRLLVPPTHPTVATRDSPETKVELTGTVRIDGTLTNVRMTSSSDDSAYRKAVEEVSHFWLFNPALKDCEFAETEGAVTLWFEKKDGEPKVSYSIPQAAKLNQLAAAQTLPQIDEKFAPGRMKGAFEKSIQDALLQWRFPPDSRGSCGQVVIHFKLV